VNLKEQQKQKKRLKAAQSHPRINQYGIRIQDVQINSKAVN